MFKVIPKNQPILLLFRLVSSVEKAKLAHQTGRKELKRKAKCST